MASSNKFVDPEVSYISNVEPAVSAQSWSLVEDYLKHLIDQALMRVVDSKNMEELYLFKGRINALKEIICLRETIKEINNKG